LVEGVWMRGAGRGGLRAGQSDSIERRVGNVLLLGSRFAYFLVSNRYFYADGRGDARRCDRVGATRRHRDQEQPTGEPPRHS
jgi:hypothetical protein